MSAAEPLVYDPYSYETDEDPYPVYRWMQDEAPATSTRWSAPAVPTSSPSSPPSFPWT